MNARQMSTEELLARATARPFEVAVVSSPGIGECLAVIPQGMVKGDAVCLVAPMANCSERDLANAELIRRALNSFELMQSTLQACANLAGEIKAGACADWRLDAIMEEAQKALTLANAK